MAHIRHPLAIVGLSVLGAAALGSAAGCGTARDDGAESATSDLTVSPDLVIRQVYGGGGNMNALYKNDFVEIFNRGTAAVSLNGKALQYASAANNFLQGNNVFGLPNVTLQPGQSFLVQLGSGGANGNALPTPDATTNATNISAVDGKLALVSAAAPLNACGGTTNPASPPCNANDYIDLVGYGNASSAEGTKAAAGSNTTALHRKNGGCTDTGDNSADFDVAAPSPRNTASALAPCSLDGGAPDAGSDGATDSGASDGGAMDSGMGDGGAAPMVLLNEVKINPPSGTDAPWEYAEILCTPGASLDGYYFVALEGDGDSSTGSPGVADIVVDLSGKSCGANGLVLVKAAIGGHASAAAQTTVVTSSALDTGTSPFENATTSFVVIKSPTTAITATTDYDANDDGTLELPAGASIVDGVSTFEQSDAAVDHTYAPRLTLTGATADAATRIVGNTTALSAAAWYFGDLSGTNADSLIYDMTKASPNTPPAAVLTPGAPNSVGTTVTDAGTSSSSSSGGSTSSSSSSSSSSSGGTSTSSSGGTSTSSSSSSGGTKKPAADAGDNAAEDDFSRSSDSGCAASPRTSEDAASFAGLGTALALALAARRRRARR